MDIKRPNRGAAFRKFTVEQVYEIRRDYDSGIRGRALAKKHKSAGRTIDQIATRVYYKWVPEE